MRQKTEKMFVIRKYILARNVGDALRKESQSEVYEVFVDEEWRKNQKDPLADSMGFKPL